MAKKISDLVAATQLGDNDSFVFNDVVAGNDKRVTASSLRADADVVKFDSVATLKTSPGKRDGQVAQLLSWHAGLEKGGSPVYWDDTSTETPNDGTIFQVTGVTTGRWKRILDRFIPITWFGTKGDGLTDDQPTIKNGIEFVKTNKLDLFFPKGDYNFTTMDTGKAGILIIGLEGIKIYGEKGTVFSSSVFGTDGTFTFLDMRFGCNNTVIENIKFTHSHGITTNISNAIFTFGSNNNLKIKSCTFESLSTSLLFNGTKNLLIESCEFYSPNGKDDGTNNTDPNVGIRFISNSNGVNIDATVRGCYGEGYSGGDITTTTSQIPLDGFVWGNVNGLLVEDNFIKYYRHEAIASGIYEEGAKHRPTIVRNNTIDSYLESGGVSMIGGFGVYITDSNVEIYNNTISGVRRGVYSYNVSYNISIENYSVRDNKFVYDYPDAALHADFIRAVYVRGRDAYKSKNIEVRGNKSYFNGVKMIDSTDERPSFFSFQACSTMEVSGNKFYNYCNRNALDLNIIRFGKSDDIIAYDNSEFGTSGYTEFYIEPSSTNINYNSLSIKESGVTLDRPTDRLKIGLKYFDTDLSKPIWYDGTNWVDATGTTV